MTTVLISQAASVAIEAVPEFMDRLPIATSFMALVLVILNLFLFRLLVASAFRSYKVRRRPSLMDGSDVWFGHGIVANLLTGLWVGSGHEAPCLRGVPSMTRMQRARR